MNAANSNDPSALLRTPARVPEAASPPGVELPTRSQIDGWTDAIGDLSSAAEAYGAAAERIEIAADAHVQQLIAPGGTEWEGNAADDAEQAGYADRGVVWQAGDLMREMRKVANTGQATSVRPGTWPSTRSMKQKPMTSASVTT